MWNRVDQRPRVRMLRRSEDVGGRAELDDPSEVHHGDPVGEVLDHGQVVRDEDDRQPELALQRCDQVQDLRLHQNVERRHRLVSHDQIGLRRQRRRDRSALSLTAGELVRTRGPVTGREADRLEELRHARFPLDRRAEAECIERLTDRAGNAPARVERAVRILVDRLRAPAERVQALSVEPRQVGAVEDDPAARRCDQVEEQAAEGALAGARLADDAEDLAGAHVEGDLVDRA